VTTDQTATATATPEGSQTEQTEGQTQEAAGILTAKATGTPATTPLATGGTADQLPGWVAALTTEQKGNAELVKEIAARFPKGAPDLVKFYAESKAKPTLTVPNEKATPEERAAFRKAMGVPDKPTDYKLEKAQTPKGFEYPDARLESLRGLLHNMGATPEQAKQFFLWEQKQRLDDIIAGTKEFKATVEQSQAQLKAEWKGNYDLQMGYMERAASAAFKQFPGAADKLSRTGLANDPDIIRIFAYFGSKITDPTFKEGTPATQETKSAAEVMYPNQGASKE